MGSYYVTAYIEATGRPVEGKRIHTSKRKALSCARALKSTLFPYGGGTCFCIERRVAADGKSREERVIWEWYTFAEGGRIVASPRSPGEWVPYLGLGRTY